ncbi:MAG: hypothetical protein KF746_14095 [Chitinophagaceae bacterium]|nr:hypothetical protein [Chitinophagaceae bacterium]
MPYEKLLVSINTIALVSTASIFFSSCIETKSVFHYAYAPLTANAPFLKEKDELQFTTHVMTGERNDDADKGGIIGVNIKGAYALSNHIGVMASYSAANEKEVYNFSNGATTLKHKRKFAEAAIGYFIAADQRKRLYFDIYAGYGTGSNNIYYVGYNNFHRSDVGRFFIQSGISLVKNEFRLTGFLRTSFLSFKNIETNYTEEELRHYDVRLYGLEKEKITSLEPTFALQFPVSKLKWLRGHAQVGAAILLNAPDLHYREVLGGIGITIVPPVASKKK